MELKMNDNEFVKFVDFMRGKYGIDLQKKRVLVESRLSATIGQMGFNSFEEFFERVYINNPECTTIMLNIITTNHTYFMREADHFEYYEKVALPWAGSVSPNKIKVWCAASSTGEEPYTLGMLALEYQSKNIIRPEIKVVASDISQKVLDKAKEGIYKKDSIGGFSASRQKRFFKEVDEQYVTISQEVRKVLDFRIFNLMDNPIGFIPKQHIIFCRNVMIYFDKESKKTLIDKLYNQLEDGGYLFMGHSEIIERSSTNFEYVKPAVYRKPVREDINTILSGNTPSNNR